MLFRRPPRIPISAPAHLTRSDLYLFELGHPVSPLSSAASTLFKNSLQYPSWNQHFPHSLKNNRGYTLKSETQAKPLNRRSLLEPWKPRTAAQTARGKIAEEK